METNNQPSLTENRLRHNFDFEYIYNIVGLENQLMLLRAIFECICGDSHVSKWCLMRLPEFVKETVSEEFIWHELIHRLPTHRMEYEDIWTVWMYHDAPDQFILFYESKIDDYEPDYPEDEFYEEFENSQLGYD
jgi:hypothetical protein